MMNMLVTKNAAMEMPAIKSSWKKPSCGFFIMAFIVSVDRFNAEAFVSWLLLMTSRRLVSCFRFWLMSLAYLLR